MARSGRKRLVRQTVTTFPSSSEVELSEILRCVSAPHPLRHKVDVNCDMADALGPLRVTPAKRPSRMMAGEEQNIRLKESRLTEGQDLPRPLRRKI